MGSPESPSQKREGPQQSRRAFLQEILSVGAVTAIPTVARALSNDHVLREKEDEEYFNRLIKDPIAQKLFQEAPSGKELGAVMRSLAKTNAGWIDPFRRDEKRMHNGALALHDNRGTFVGNGTVLKIPVGKKQGDAETYHYLVATASHVADRVLPPLGTGWTRHPKERDVTVRELSAAERMSLETGGIHALLFPMRDERDISGEVGVVVAHDNDHGPLARKLYPSRISPLVISRRVLIAANIRPPEQAKYYRDADFATMRMVVLPSGQAKEASNKAVPAEGVSGSAFVYMPLGSTEPAFGGMFAGAAKARAEGVSYDTGYVIDRSCVRETIAEHFKESSA